MRTTSGLLCLLWLAALLLLACAEPANAVLEVRMHLPARTAEASDEELRFAYIAVVPSDVDLSASRSFEADAKPYDLSKPGCNVELSIVAKDPRKDRERIERQGERGLSMLVWFCATKEPCKRADAPNWLIDFDKALWTGERTLFEADVPGGTCSSWQLAETTLPAVQSSDREQADFDFMLRVPACSVLGCLDESSVPAADVGFCSVMGVHPCD